MEKSRFYLLNFKVIISSTLFFIRKTERGCEIWKEEKKKNKRKSEWMKNTCIFAISDVVTFFILLFDGKLFVFVEAIPLYSRFFFSADLIDRIRPIMHKLTCQQQQNTNYLLDYTFLLAITQVTVQNNVLPLQTSRKSHYNWNRIINTRSIFFSCPFVCKLFGDSVLPRPTLAFLFFFV